MRPQKVLDKDILTGLTKVFRAEGYEGASLKDLSDATGLKKASLYHRFPNGKQEMAKAVLAHLGDWVSNHVFASLMAKEVSPQIRLKNGISEISRLYDGGKDTCIFRALSMQAGIMLFEEQIKNGMAQWIAAFEDLGLALNFSNEKAEAYAIQTLIDIQGSLIVSKGLKNLKVFENTLKKIESKYLE